MLRQLILFVILLATSTVYLSGCEANYEENQHDEEAALEQLKAEKKELEGIIENKKKTIQDYEDKLDKSKKLESESMEIISRIEDHATDLIPEIDETEVGERFDDIGSWVLAALDRYKMYEEILLELPDEIIIEQTMDFWTYKIVVLEYENRNLIESTEFPADGNIEVSETDIRVRLNDVVKQSPYPFVPPTGGTIEKKPRIVLQNRIDELIMQEARLDLSEHVEVLNAKVEHFYRAGSCNVNAASWVIEFNDEFVDGDEINIEISEALREKMVFNTNSLTIMINAEN